MPRTAVHLLTYMFPMGHWGLIRQLVAREIALRYRQSWLGTAWLLLTPMLMLAVYTLVFRHVLNLRWPGSSGTDGGDLAFAANLFSGLLVFNFFSECVGRAPRLVLDQPHLVKKVVFPLQVLAWTNLLQALVGLVVSLGLLVLARLIDGAELAPAMLTLPLIWLPLAMLVLGLGWIFVSSRHLHPRHWPGGWTGHQCSAVRQPNIFPGHRTARWLAAVAAVEPTDNGD